MRIKHGSIQDKSDTTRLDRRHHEGEGRNKQESVWDKHNTTRREMTVHTRRRDNGDKQHMPRPEHTHHEVKGVRQAEEHFGQAQQDLTKDDVAHQAGGHHGQA